MSWSWDGERRPEAGCGFLVGASTCRMAKRPQGEGRAPLPSEREVAWVTVTTGEERQARRCSLGHGFPRRLELHQG